MRHRSCSHLLGQAATYQCGELFIHRSVKFERTYIEIRSEPIQSLGSASTDQSRSPVSAEARIKVGRVFRRELLGQNLCHVLLPLFKAFATGSPRSEPKNSGSNSCARQFNVPRSVYSAALAGRKARSRSGQV